MATLEEAVFSILTGDAGVAALVGDRVYPQRLPQDPTLPAITYQRIDTPRVHTHDSGQTDNLARPRVQIQSWAADVEGAAGYDTANAVILAVVGAVEGFRGTVAGVEIGAMLTDNETEGFDETGDRLSRVLDVLVFFGETVS